MQFKLTELRGGSYMCETAVPRTKRKIVKHGKTTVIENWLTVFGKTPSACVKTAKQMLKKNH